MLALSEARRILKPGGWLKIAVPDFFVFRSSVPADDIARLHAPIGLIPSSRDPQVLALSTLAEIVRDFERVTARDDVVSELTT